MVRTKYRVCLSEAERAYLQTLVGRGTAPARLLADARILLKANQGAAGPGWADAAIAAAVAVGLSTVARVRQRYVAAGLEAALHRKGPDRAYHRTLDGAQEAHLVALACSVPPAGRKRWPLRLLAARLVAREVGETVSHQTVRQTVKQPNARRG